MLAIGYFQDTDGETNVHEFAIQDSYQYVQAHGACDVVTLQLKSYRDWKEPLTIAALDFRNVIEKWLEEQNLVILPYLAKKDMRCPRCGKEMESLGSVFIEWGSGDPKGYDEEGNADTWVCGRVDSRWPTSWDSIWMARRSCLSKTIKTFMALPANAAGATQTASRTASASGTATLMNVMSSASMAHPRKRPCTTLGCAARNLVSPSRSKHGSYQIE